MCWDSCFFWTDKKGDVCRLDIARQQLPKRGSRFEMVQVWIMPNGGNFFLLLKTTSATNFKNNLCSSMKITKWIFFSFFSFKQRYTDEGDLQAVCFLHLLFSSFCLFFLLSFIYIIWLRLFLVFMIFLLRVFSFIIFLLFLSLSRWLEMTQEKALFSPKKLQYLKVLYDGITITLFVIPRMYEICFN